MQKEELDYYIELQDALFRLDDEDDTPKAHHGNTHLPYGLCKEMGIDTPNGTTPKQAWELLSGKGITPKETYAKLKNGEKGKDIAKGKGTAPTKPYDVGKVTDKDLKDAKPFVISNKKGFTDLPVCHGDLSTHELEKGFSVEKGFDIIKKILPSLKNGIGKTNIKLMNPYSKGSMSHHISSHGGLSKNREKLHAAILGKSLDGVKKPTGTPTYTFLGGGPASGKSTTLNSGMIDFVPDKKNAVYVDPDAVKTYLPEYQAALKEKDSRAGAYCHEESGLISRRLEWIGRDNGYNVVSDGTGDRSVSYMKERIQKAREAGMKVNGLYMTCDVEKAVERSYKRFQETGRLVPESNVRSVHQSVSQIFPQIASDFDHVELYDTDDETPVKIAECNHGQPIKILDQEKYDKFLKKAMAW